MSQVTNACANETGIRVTFVPSISNTSDEVPNPPSRRRSLPTNPCYACGTQDYSSGDFGHYSIRAECDGIVSVPLGATYKINMPKGSQLCFTCFGMAVDGHVPDLTVEKMYPIECQVCHQKFESALPYNESEPSTQGFQCSCFYYPPSKSVHGAWGSTQYDDDNLPITDLMPSDVLQGLIPMSLSICDHCVTLWINNGWLVPPNHYSSPSVKISPYPNQ